MPEVVFIGVAPVLGDLRFLSSSAHSYGITYYNEATQRVGVSDVLAVPAAGSGSDPATLTPPTGAVTAVIKNLQADGSTPLRLFVDVGGGDLAASGAADFKTNYQRFPSMLLGPGDTGAFGR